LLPITPAAPGEMIARTDRSLPVLPTAVPPARNSEASLPEAPVQASAALNGRAQAVAHPLRQAPRVESNKKTKKDENKNKKSGFKMLNRLKIFYQKIDEGFDK
jgi:hypothetical protein